MREDFNASFSGCGVLPHDMPYGKNLSAYDLVQERKRGVVNYKDMRYGGRFFIPFARAIKQ
jgi:hypothetical protein